MKKLSLSLILIVIFGTIFLGWGISHYYSSYMESSLPSDDPVLQTYTHLGKTLALNLIHRDQAEYLLQAQGKNDAIQLSLTHRSDLIFPDALAKRFLKGESVTLESHKHLSLYFPIAHSDHVLTLEIENLTSDNGNLARLTLTLIFYAGVLALVSVWLYPLIRQLQKLQAAAMDFGSGNLNAHLKQSRYSYISDLEHAFNNMAERIRSLINDNKLLSRAVSHDLKTPLARLRFGIETLAETQSKTQREKYHKRIEMDLAEMESLVEILLQYARLDEATIHLEKTPINMNDLINNTVSSLGMSNKVSITADDNCYVLGDEKYISMLAQNILANAYDYARHTILVTIKSDAEGLTFSVEDDGPGIPEKKRETVIQPFSRGDTIKRDQRKGHGMGLAIVDRVVKWHSGKLRIDQSPALNGARLRVFFPKEAATQ